MRQNLRWLLTWMGLTLPVWMPRATLGADGPSKPSGVSAQRTVIAELGPEHMANAVYRRGVGGDRIAAWGDRILQWEVQPAATATEVVPREQNVLGYSNGGCAMDLQGKGNDADGPWECHPVDNGLYCPHSLVLADVNADGRLDVLAGEMTAGGWSFPLNPKPRLLLYLNEGHLRFTRHILDTGWGVHEMRLAPPRSDGKLMLYAADEIQLHKFKDMNTHLVSWAICP